MARIPHGEALLHGDTLLAWVTLDEGEGMTADQGEILRPIFTADLPPIFAEGDVEDVVELVFDLPMVANARGQQYGLGGMAGDVEGASDRELFADADADDLGDALQVDPGSLNIYGEFTDGQGSHDALLETSVPFIALDGELCGMPRHGIEKLDDMVVERALIALEGQDVVRAALPDRSGDLSGAAGRISSHGGSFDVQSGQELDRRSRLMSCGLDGRLPEKQALLGGPDMKQVKRSMPTPCVGQSAAKSLAVDGDGLPLELAQKRLEPAAKSLLKSLRIECFEDAAEGVGARSAVGHIEKLGEELLLDLGVIRQRVPAIGSSQSPEERHRQDIDQRMGARPRDTRVLDLTEDVEKRLQNGRRLLSGHRRTGSCPDRLVSITRQPIEIDQVLMRSPWSSTRLPARSVMAS